MSPKKPGVFFSIAVIGMTLASCAEPAPSPLDYTVRRATGVASSPLLESAEIVLTQLGYPIAKRDPAAGWLLSEPVEGEVGATSSGHRVGLSSRPSGRRVVDVRIEDRDGLSKVFCRVTIQEQTSRAHQMFSSAYARDDVPNDTAIDRDAATTKEQNTVWEPVGRDKSAERIIVQAILDRAGVPASAGGD